MIDNQTNIFEMLYETYKITKPIRLITLFSGYDSQALALKYLGVDYEHYKTCEWAIKSIQALKDLHFENDNTDYSKNLTDDEVKEYLLEKGISSNYNDPMSKEQIKRLKNHRQIYNNIQATHNLVNIQQVKGKDLDIKDTNKYCYIMTYSFPCQDLSLAGNRKGMSDTSTRSGMLWEVERILGELEEKPQVLLMENVIQVHGEGNKEDFNKWQLRLEKLGYKNYWQDLIATDYGIPQTRNRCFMISILGDYNYTFPKSIPLKLKLKDMLEDKVDDEYYLSEDLIKHIQKTAEEHEEYTQYDRYNGDLEMWCRVWKDKSPTLNTKRQDTKIYVKNGCKQVYDLNYYNHEQSNRVYSIDYSSPTLRTKCDEAGTIKIKNATQKGYLEASDGDGVDLAMPNSETRRGRVQKEAIQTLTTQNNLGVVSDLRIRKLTPKECFRLMGVKDEDFEKISKNQSDSSLYHLAGDSIVVNVLMAIFKELL